MFPFFVCRCERRKYHSHREKSRSSPDKYLTIIVDGMDQSKTNLPNTKLISKSTSSLWRLRTHVTGVILHTKAPMGKLVYSYIDLIQYPHDTNSHHELLGRFYKNLCFTQGVVSPNGQYVQRKQK